jgi:hypothetical protein
MYVVVEPNSAMMLKVGGYTIFTNHGAEDKA